MKLVPFGAPDQAGQGARQVDNFCRAERQVTTTVFDLDGTLADTSRDLIAAANACLGRRNGVWLLDAEKDASAAFAGGRAMIRLGFTRQDARWSEDDVDAAYPVFLDRYADAIDRHTVLYPGVRNALDALAAQGSALAVCTNKPEALALELLGRLNILGLFGAVLGADTLPVRKPDPEHLLETIRRVGGDPGTSVLVGDTVNDRETALRAGVPCILVAFGPTGADIGKLSPEAILDHFDSLPAMVEEVISRHRSKTALHGATSGNIN